MNKSARTSTGLRDLLFESIEMVRDGDMEPKRAIAIAALADRVISSARLDADLSLAFAAVERDNDTKLEPKVIGFTDG